MNAQTLIKQLDKENVLSGEIKKIAKEIKKDHVLAQELWASKKIYPRMLATLILDPKELSQEYIETLAGDMLDHNLDGQNQLSDWLLANQLMKNKKAIELLLEWREHKSSVLRRLYWYYQGRLRWMGKTDFENTDELLGYIESDLAGEKPEVQWAMNFTGCWIGLYDMKRRDKTIKIGEKIGLYKGDPVAPNCAPDYIPEFIEYEDKKRNK